MKRAILVALVHCTIILSLAGKYHVDRERLPRVWMKTAPFDPNLPIRGRYVRLSLQLPDAPTAARVRLSVENGNLMVAPGGNDDLAVFWGAGNSRSLAEPVAFFLPEHVADPSIRNPGEELWLEASIPAHGPPRPVRLGVMKDGVLNPLDLR